MLSPSLVIIASQRKKLKQGVWLKQMNNYVQFTLFNVIHDITILVDDFWEFMEQKWRFLEKAVIEENNASSVCGSGARLRKI